MLCGASAAPTEPEAARLSPWTRQLLGERARAMAQVPSAAAAHRNGKACKAAPRRWMDGCVLLSPVPRLPANKGDPGADARLEYRYLRDEDHDVAQKTAGEATPWRLCQTLASVDSRDREQQVVVSADAFNTIVCDEDGSNERSMTLARLGETLPHRFSSLELHATTSLRMPHVACKLRTALVPVAPSDRWRTEVRCVLRRRPDAAPCALLLASQFGAALDVALDERESVDPLPLQPTCLVEDRLGTRTGQCYTIELTSPAKSGSPLAPTRSSSAEAEVRLGPVALEGEDLECVAWQITVPIGAAPAAPAPAPAPTRKQKRTRAEPENSDCEGLVFESGGECDTDEDEPLAFRPPKRARARPATVARGRCSGPRRPLKPGLAFGCAPEGLPEATAMRIARVPCHQELTAKLLRVEARAQAQALRRLREGPP